MPDIRPPLPKIPTPVFIIAITAGVVFSTIAFFVWSWTPDPEKVFWRTVENNLDSRSVSLETEVWLGLPEEADILLLNNSLEMDFRHGGLRFQQETLFYGENVPGQYVNPLQLEQYHQAGLAEPPAEEWYEQECYILPAGVWARHDLYTRPSQADWSRLFGGSEENPPWGGGWRRFGLDGNNFLSWQHFLMISATSGGFFHGSLPPEERAEVVRLLKQAYEVDFSRTRTFRRSGRPFHEYQVSFDQAALGRAFVYYFNAQAEAIGLEERLSLGSEQTANIFQVRDISHTVVIDAWSGRITKIEHPLEIGPGWLAQGLSEDFVVSPLLSPIIANAALDPESSLTVITRTAAQDRRLDLDPPLAEGQAAR